ncbi:uncharacterized protein LOC130677370 [Microplitis mediator]|uniref:uncharacterized protein LOC130677370 n=1 Tax=Microplitis mediator TaxID=375433 RepID=UPI002552C0BA|nr:uncharacterized protein LOC130677370 [Microplitis mediator]
MKIRKMSKKSETCEFKKLDNLENNKNNDESNYNNNNEVQNNISEVKKRKRKINNSENNFENKKKCENLEVKHVSTENVDDDVGSEGQGEEDEEREEEEEIISKNDQQLTVKYFRNSFSSENALGALKKFVALCDTNGGKKNFADEYLNSGGNIMEILKLIDSVDKKHLNNIALVFNALYLLIMRIIANHPQQLSTTMQACRHILNNHISLLHSLMSNSSTPKQRKTVLKLLTSIVMLGDSLPRDLLTHLSFHSQTIDLLVQQTKPSDPDSVRICFINFILSFLIDNDSWTVRSLLEKRGLLASIFPDLIYDPPHIVHLVMNVLKKYVLENASISKTQKFHIFTTPTIQSLVRLYNWRGPKAWPGASKRKSQDLSDPTPAPQDKEVAVTAAHELLTTLLTSTRHGVIFADRSLGTKGKHNQRVASVIESLDRPWEHSRPRELITKILSACPDLIKLVLTSCEPFFEPRLSLKWINVISFYRDIISAVDLTYLERCLTNLNILQCINVSLTLATPITILKSAIAPSVSSEHLVVRHQALLTLSAMLNKLRALFKLVHNHFPTREFLTYRLSIQNYLIKHLPPLDVILKSWNDLGKEYVGESSEIVECLEYLPGKVEHLEAVLEVLENYRDILDNLEVGHDSKIDYDFKEGDDQIEVRVRIIEINFWLNSKAYDINEKLFSDCLIFLIKFIGYNQAHDQGQPDLEQDQGQPEQGNSGQVPANQMKPGQARGQDQLDDGQDQVQGDQDQKNLNTRLINTLKLILTPLKAFQNSSEQINIWIQSFSLIPNPQRTELAEWFVKLLKKITKCPEKYQQIVKDAEKALKKRDKNVEVNSGAIPIIFTAGVNSLRENYDENVNTFMSYVTILTLHCQNDTKSLGQVIENTDLKTKYVVSWLEGRCSSVKKYFPCKLIGKVSKMVLGKEKIEIGDLETYEIGQIDFEIENLFKMILFYFTQMVGNEDYEVRVHNCKVALLWIFNRIKRRGQAHDCNLDSTVSYPELAADKLDSGTGKEDLAAEDSGLIDNIDLADHKMELDVTTADVSVDKTVLGVGTTKPAAKISLNDETNIFYKFSRLFVDHPAILNNFSFIETGYFCNKVISVDCFDIFVLISSSNESSIFSAYKEKLLSDLTLAIDEKFSSTNAIDRLEYFEIFEFGAQEIYDLVSKILDLSSKKFYSDSLTTVGKLVSKLIYLLAEKSSDFNSKPILFEKLWRHFSKLKSKKIDVSAWEDAVLNFLLKNEIKIDEDRFVNILKNLNESTIKLINLIVKQNDDLMPRLTKFLSAEEFKNPGVLFPILSSNLTYKWDPDFLNAIFSHYAPAILSYFDHETEGNDWIARYPNVTSFLITNNFTRELCQLIADKLLESREKLESIECNYLTLVRIVWEKRAEFEPAVDTVEEYVQILLPITVSALKKSKKDEMRLKMVINYLSDALDKLKKLKTGDYLFEKIIKNNSFKQFINFSLKYGMKIEPPNPKIETSKPTIDNSKPTVNVSNLINVLNFDFDLSNFEFSTKNLNFDITTRKIDTSNTKIDSILEVLSKLLDLTYRDNSPDNYIEQIYEMTRTNANFDEILLSKSSTKTSLLRLFSTLCHKVPSKIHADDLKVLLSAYEATMKPADQQLLEIFQFYESRGFHLNPHALLWGRAAVNYHSSVGNVDTALWRQVTGSQILDLLDADMVARTVQFYPIDRGLQSASLAVDYAEIYDPAFYLPLFVSLSTTDKLVPTHKLVKSGAMALVFSACASTHSEVRLAAYTALSQFYFHLDAAKSKDKLLWIRCIDALRNGINQLMESNNEDFSKLENVRLSSLITTFLARASLISAKEGNLMFAPIQGYFMAKQALDLKTIPEFLTLFHSADVNHKIYRHWMLECVRDGLKCYDDVKLALRIGIFKMIMDFYGCVLADNDTRALILQIIEATVKIPRSNFILIKNYSLFVWLHELTSKLDKRNRQIVNLLFNIIGHLLDNNNNSKYNNNSNNNKKDHESKSQEEYGKFMILMILKNLKALPSQYHQKNHQIHQ